MGYTTDFEGSLRIYPVLNEKQRDYINLLCETRRMKRDVNKLMELYQGKHGNPFATEETPEAIYGNDGEYFAMDDNRHGQTDDASVIDFNTPPGQAPYDRTTNFNNIWDKNETLINEGKCQPGLWCKWRIDHNGNYLSWDGGEKFYNYVEWLKYLINHFFSKWGVLLNGEITWEGEESDDIGKIVVIDNVVTIKNGTIVYED